MIGKAEVVRQRNQLESTFERARALGADAELLSDFSRYLCVRVSGFFEQAVIELLLEYVRARSDARTQAYTESQLRRLTNIKSQRLFEVLGAFDADWRRSMETFLVDERKDAVDSVVHLRNMISHGHFSGITMTRVRKYYECVRLVVDEVGRLTS